MRQLLMLGFQCNVYRREPRCRVYVNDILLDEFDIPHYPSEEIFSKNNFFNMRLDPTLTFSSIEFSKVQKNPIFLKYIEFDDLDNDFVDIKIEIKNNDNNYSNGFMNKYSRIKLSYFFLLPKNLLNKIEHLKTNWKFSYKNYHIYNKKNIDVFYSNKRNQIFENFSEFLKLEFPDIIQTYKEESSFRKYSKNWKDLPVAETCNTKPSQYWIGSSGNFYLKLKKKLGLWIEKSDRRKGYWRLGSIDIVEHFYNKYKQYEDTRSDNT